MLLITKKMSRNEDFFSGSLGTFLLYVVSGIVSAVLVMSDIQDDRRHVNNEDLPIFRGSWFFVACLYL